MLDGIGAGCFGVLTVLIMSDLSQGTGRFSLLQGALSTGIGIGAAMSNGLGGVLTDQVGFEFMFMFFVSFSFFYDSYLYLYNHLLSQILKLKLFLPSLLLDLKIGI